MAIQVATGGATIRPRATGADCGPMPGGNPPGGIGIPSGPGAIGVAASEVDFKCTKLRLFGKSSTSAPELRSRMSTGFGQLVAVISTRNEVVQIGRAHV